MALEQGDRPPGVEAYQLLAGLRITSENSGKIIKKTLARDLENPKKINGVKITKEIFEQESIGHYKACFRAYNLYSKDVELNRDVVKGKNSFYLNSDGVKKQKALESAGNLVVEGFINYVDYVDGLIELKITKNNIRKQIHLKNIKYNVKRRQMQDKKKFEAYFRLNQFDEKAKQDFKKEIKESEKFYNKMADDYEKVIYSSEKREVKTVVLQKMVRDYLKFVSSLPVLSKQEQFKQGTRTYMTNKLREEISKLPEAEIYKEKVLGLFEIKNSFENLPTALDFYISSK